MEQSLVPGLVAEGAHTGLEVLSVDAAGALVVKKVKSLLDLHDFLGADSEFLIILGIKSSLFALRSSPAHKI